MTKDFHSVFRLTQAQHKVAGLIQVHTVLWSAHCYTVTHRCYYREITLHNLSRAVSRLSPPNHFFPLLFCPSF